MPDNYQASWQKHISSVVFAQKKRFAGTGFHNAPPLITNAKTTHLKFDTAIMITRNSYILILYVQVIRVLGSKKRGW